MFGRACPWLKTEATTKIEIEINNNKVFQLLTGTTIKAHKNFVFLHIIKAEIETWMVVKWKKIYCEANACAYGMAKLGIEGNNQNDKEIVSVIIGIFLMNILKLSKRLLKRI